MTLVLQHPYWMFPSLRRKAPDQPSRFAPMPPLAPRPVVDEAEVRGADPLAWAGRSVLFCGSFRGCIGEMRIWLNSVGALSSSVGETLMPFEWIERHAHAFDVALVDCDHFEDADDVVDFGLHLRRIAPRLPVVMASSTVARNDFGMERRAICDATLRKPFSRSAFFIGVGVAMANRANALATEKVA
ncbi:MAG: hypothetical protein GC186_11570 [Rhodobacteraceae bacterium]|nr:hypothetical protein [Paracoccaceae bacterium]